MLAGDCKAKDVICFGAAWAHYNPRWPPNENPARWVVLMFNFVMNCKTKSVRDSSE